MINKVIELALRQRMMVILLVLALVGYGIFTIVHLNVAAFPDVTNIQVSIITSARGLAAEQVEKLVTFPIEIAMAGLPGSDRKSVV